MASFELIQGPKDPANTKRASSVTEMYSMVSNPRQSSFDFQYQMGELSSDTQSVIIRNNTTNTNLVVAFSPPKFVETDSMAQFVITPRTTIEVRVRLSDNVIITHAASGTKSLQEQLTISVAPTQNTDPVFIDTSLTPL